MYKDKDRQREANRKAQAKFKAKGITKRVLPKSDKEVFGETMLKMTSHEQQLKRGKDIKCFADLPPDVQKSIDRMSINKDGTINQTVKANRTAIAINYQHLFPNSYESAGDLDFTRLLAQASPGHVRVSKPGDADYIPQCQTTRDFMSVFKKR